MYNLLLQLAIQLMPTGRAFRLLPDSEMRRLFKVVAVEEQKIVDGGKNVIDAMLPDNDNFTAQDATDAERRYGLITNTDLSLEQRKLLIKRKMNHPGGILPRQNYRYLQQQLQDAGFDLYVFENRFEDAYGNPETRVPGEVALTSISQIYQLGQHQLGTHQLGQSFDHKVANSLDAGADANFNPGTQQRRTFYVGGTPLGTVAEVDATREEELRELILKIKPTQTVAWLLINYV